MKKETGIKLFDSEQIRSAWNAEEEKWYFSIIDVIEVISKQNAKQLAQNKKKEIGKK